MDTEFHYWMTGIIAKAAGFTDDEARIIAYSSEYVDENDRSITVEDRSNGEKYRNYISQTMNILKPAKELMRIYPIFHFIPGDPAAETAQRRDGKMHLLNTTPNSLNANLLMDDALADQTQKRLYRIGVATHAYVDTWAHQNFVGWDDYFNNIGYDPKPNIGHLDAEHHPDWPAHRWNDERLVKSDIDNRLRFLGAAKALFMKYCNFQVSIGQPNKNAEWDDLEAKLTNAMGTAFSGEFNCYKDSRINGYKALLGVGWPEFDEMEWFDAAINTKVNGFKDPGNGITALFTIFPDDYFWKDGVDKTTTHWYLFQDSVKAHEKKALEILADTFGKMGIDLGKA